VQKSWVSVDKFYGGGVLCWARDSFTVVLAATSSDTRALPRLNVLSVVKSARLAVALRTVEMETRFALYHCELWNVTL